LLPTEPACWSWLPMTPMELLARARTRAPAWYAPVWDDLAALVEWHEGRCATCGRSEGLSLQYDHEHLPGEDRRAGRLRRLLCPSCNMREARYGGLLFDAYRRRPPAVILNIEVPYWTLEGGYARRQPSVCWLRRGS
jgi:Recombination endonuclease VII